MQVIYLQRLEFLLMFKLLLREAEGGPARPGDVCLPEAKDPPLSLGCEPRRKTLRSSYLSRDLACDGAEERPSWILVLKRQSGPSSTLGRGHQHKPGLMEGSWDTGSHPSLSQQLRSTRWLLPQTHPALGSPVQMPTQWPDGYPRPHYHATELARNTSALRVQSNPNASFQKAS